MNSSMEATKRREEMDQTFLFHRVMTQGHRWFLLYEHQEVDLRNQLDILAPDVHIHSSFGEANNRQEYAQAATNLPAHWRNAHHVLAADVKARDDGSVTLTMEVAFQNTGYLPDGKMMANRLRYTTALSGFDAFLPSFKEITTQQIGPETDSAFASWTSAYADNRTKSLVHYWLALIEANMGDATPFREIIAEGPDFDFTTQRIHSFADFQQWFGSTSTNVLKSSHVMDSFALEPLGSNRYHVSFSFDWCGFARSDPDQELIARTNHEWIVTDNPAERFARVQAIKVQAVKPFQPKAKGHRP